MIKQKSSEMGVSKKEKRGLVITEIFMILLAAVWFIPIYYLIVTTFKNPQEATQSPLGLPKVWVFQNYVDAFVNMQYPRALFNTCKNYSTCSCNYCFGYIHGRLCAGKNEVQMGKPHFPAVPCRSGCSVPDEYCQPV